MPVNINQDRYQVAVDGIIPVVIVIDGKYVIDNLVDTNTFKTADGIVFTTQDGNSLNVIK